MEGWLALAVTIIAAMGGAMLVVAKSYREEWIFLARVMRPIGILCGALSAGILIGVEAVGSGWAKSLWFWGIAWIVAASPAFALAVVAIDKVVERAGRHEANRARRDDDAN